MGLSEETEVLGEMEVMEVLVERDTILLTAYLIAVEDQGQGVAGAMRGTAATEGAEEMEETAAQ